MARCVEDGYSGRHFLQQLDEVEGRELATLVRIEYLRLAVARQRLLDRFDAERRLQRDRQLP